MPSELRHLLFRPAEVVEAVKDYHRRLGTPLPTGSIVHCGPESDDAGGAVRFRITLAPATADGGPPSKSGEKAGRHEVVIEGPSLAAALILFCREQRIPLRASADKSLQRFGEQVCLLATSNPKGEAMPKLGQIRP